MIPKEFPNIKMDGGRNGKPDGTAVIPTVLYGHDPSGLRGRDGKSIS